MALKYDFVLVGAGLTNATIASVLKTYGANILVLETRCHIGGNCYDYKNKGTWISLYGPHIFHSKSSKIINYLKNFAEFQKIEYSVQSYITSETKVTFPYTIGKTDIELGKSLTNEEIVDIFFKPYSEKMWGKSWEELPQTITNRVPKIISGEYNYFNGEQPLYPKNGFTNLIENMFDGTEIVLNASPRDWDNKKYKKIIYTGRPDFILHEDYLDFRDLIIEHRVEDFSNKNSAYNYASKYFLQTRKTFYRNLTGGSSNITSLEYPKESDLCVSPFYPYPDEENKLKHKKIIESISVQYPNIVCCGRLGSYRYQDMDFSVAEGIKIANQLLKIDDIKL